MIGFLRELNIYSVILRVFLSLIIGGIIGLERERKNQPAGLRTYMLVCMGATLVMMTNQYMFLAYGSGDIARMGAQVISGIGFLGAGTILVTRSNQVRGLTTAAGLWSAACVGLAIGIGFYEGAVLVAVGIMVIMSFLLKWEGFVRTRSMTINLYINMTSIESVTDFVIYCRQNDYIIIDMQVSKDTDAGHHMIALIISLQLMKGTSHVQAVEDISQLEYVKYIQEM